METRTVREAGIEGWAGAVDPQPQRSHHALDGSDYGRIIGKADRGTLQAAGALDPNI